VLPETLKYACSACSGMFLSHVMDKWDSYLSMLLGVFVAVSAKAIVNAKLLVFFK